MSSATSSSSSCLAVEPGVVGRCGQPTFRVCPLFDDACLPTVRLCGGGEHPLRRLLAARDCLLLMHLAKMLVLVALQWLADRDNFSWITGGRYGGGGGEEEQRQQQGQQALLEEEVEEPPQEKEEEEPEV